ncbi:hypothetical protein [Butyrivibrio sp. YAB3001]|uniref:hypothetical protein n=1 Tax=Butyrivibrio sp. YAB3001 TaxID=1520812 RepID=UPI0008F61BE4|nr:hypothetical protein [Butyrivibrio sp. YAB3001]SFC41078.1 hypothetical protein SAMN02910398_02188 [Butyrivibrio sp. YAB3001]
MNIHLCKGDETLQQALEYINQNDSEGRKYTFDAENDRCYVGDEAFVNAPVIINYKNQYYALHIV